MAGPLPVSVVIPAFRRADTVGRAVRSVLAQSAAPAQVLVVDDASGDDTAAAARAAGAEVLALERNRGEGGARNAGIDAAEQPWIALLDSDDEWLPWHLEALWALRGDHVLAGAALAAVGQGRLAGRVLGWRGPRPRILRGPNDVMWPENVVTPSGALVHRETVLAAGGFAEGMPQAADNDTWVRILERGTGIASPQVGVLYHVHADQASADLSSMIAARTGLYRRYADRPWYRPAIVRRIAAVGAWDLRDRSLLLRAVSHPQGAYGLLFTYAHRAIQRRQNRRRRADLAARGIAL